MKGALRQRAGRPPDYWELEVEAPRDPLTGKRRRIARAFHGNRREAESALAELVTEVNQGRGKGTKATVGDLLVRWLATIEGSHSPWTIRRYLGIVSRHLMPAFGTTQLRRLTGADVDAFYAALVADGLAPATVRQVHAVLRRSLTQAVRWGWIVANPAQYAVLPARHRKRLSLPTPEVVSNLIDRAKQPSRRQDGTLGVWLHLAAVTGARRGEVCGLRWRDLDGTGGLLIERAIVDGGDRVVEKGTKTHQARRIKLDPGTLTLLVDHRIGMEKRASGAGVELHADAFVFSDDLDGIGPWRPQRVTLAFHRLCQSAGVTPFRLHDLRHLAATQMLTGGIDVRTVAGRLGHANPSVTLDVYGHFIPAADEKAADLLGGLLRPQGT